jgi:hypothetical protein
MQNAFGLMPHVDFTKLIGGAPALWRVLDADTNPYAVGDVVVDSLQSVAGVPVIKLHGGVPGPSGELARTRSLLESIVSEFGVVVGVSPASFLDAAQPVIAGGGGSSRFVWILPAAGHLFDIIGDSTVPSRGEVLSGGPAVAITAQGVNDGGITASLRYSPPVGNGSGTKLDGGSFNLQGAGELAIVGLAPNVPLAPGALYRVHLRYPQALRSPPTQQSQSSFGL